MEISKFLMIALCNLINVYALYRFYNYAFYQNRFSAKIEKISFICYWVVNNFIYLFINIPLITFLSSFIGYYLLTLNYRGRQKQKIFLSVFFCIAMVFIESIVVFLVTKAPLDLSRPNEYINILGHILISILIYLFVEILWYRRKVDYQIKIPNGYFLGLLSVPLLSVIIILYFMSLKNISLNGVSFCCVLFLGINISVFYLYDKIIDYASAKKEQGMLKQKNSEYLHLLESMKTSEENARRIRHDFKNHAVVMESLLSAKKYDELREYQKYLSRNLAPNAIHSGNIVVDSILNFKLQECKRRQIKLNTHIAIPENMNIPQEAFTIILGNLLDNAITAVDKLTEKREITLDMFYEIGTLYLDLENLHKERLKSQNGIFQSTREDWENHGYGLKSVKLAVEDCGGSIFFDVDNQSFHVSVIFITE